MNNHDEPTLDPATLIELDGPDLHLAEAINPDGSRTIWILGDDNGTHGCPCPHCAPHDQLDTTHNLPTLTRPMDAA